MISDSIEPTIKQPLKKKLRFNALGKWLVFLSLLLLAGGGGFFIYQQTVVQPRQQARRNRQTVPIARENLTVTVTANGTIQPEMSINLSPKTSGILRQLFVKEGDAVEVGQVVAKMDDSNLQGQLLQAKGQLAQAEANLQKLIAGNRPQDIAQAQAQLNEAQANLQKVKVGNRPQDIAQAQARLQNAQSQLQQAESTFQQNDRLYKQGAISERTWLDSQSLRDRAQSQVLEAQKALELQQAGSRPEDILQAQATVQQRQQALSLAKAGSRIEDIAQARAQVISARGTLKTIQTQVNDTFIRAPFDGTVTRKYADPGAFVTPTTAGSSVSSATSSSILSLASANQIVVNVAESNIAQMRLGQKAIITADAYPGKKFAGKVTQISPQSIVVQNVTSFEVKVKILDDKENLLRSGMNVNVTFDAGTLENVLVVPTVAIVRQTEGTGVYVQGESNRPKFVQISTGLTVNDKTEVRSGLKGSERIFITFPEGTRPRSRVPGGSNRVPGLGGR
ncbi:RND family efflux transporter MFP subunit [Calothrix sp. NIES-4101]|nr:RND family efflux transporter MFP subunit [Calothrix sp. NIES-4101]